MALTAAEKAWRKMGIGGSDAITIARGTGREWFELREEKINDIEKQFSPDARLRMDLGSACEPVLLDYLDATVTRLGNRNVQCVMAADTCFRCTLDAITLVGQPVQIKFHFGLKSIDELVEFYWPQLQHELLVTGERSLVFAAGFGHWARFEHQVVPPDAAFQNGYMARALQFKAFCWQNAELPAELKYDEVAPQIATSIPRLRDHVWPTGDNKIAPLAKKWLLNGEAAAEFAEAAKGLKAEFPDDARSATWMDGGVGLKITANKAGAKSIKAHIGKA